MVPNLSSKKLLSFSDGEENEEFVDLKTWNKVSVKSRPQEDVWKSLSQKTEKFKKKEEKEEKEVMERFKDTGKYNSVNTQSNKPVGKDLINMLQQRNKKNKYTHPKFGGRRLVPKPQLPKPEPVPKRLPVAKPMSSDKPKEPVKPAVDKVDQEEKQEIPDNQNKPQILSEPPVAPQDISPDSSNLDDIPPGLSASEPSDITPPGLSSTGLPTSIDPPPGLAGDGTGDAPPGLTEKKSVESDSVPGVSGENPVGGPPGLAEDQPAEPPGLTEKLPLPPGLAITSPSNALPLVKNTAPRPLAAPTPDKQSSSEIAEQPTLQPDSTETVAAAGANLTSAQETKPTEEPKVSPPEDEELDGQSTESSVPNIAQDIGKNEVVTPSQSKQASPSFAAASEAPLPVRTFSRSPSSNVRSPSRSRRSRSKSRRRRSQAHRTRSRSRGRRRSRSRYRRSVRSRSKSRGRRRRRRSRSRGLRSRSRVRRSRSRRRRSRSRRRGRRSRTRSRSRFRGRRRRGRKSRSRSRTRGYRKGSSRRQRNRSRSRSNRYSKHGSPREKTSEQAGATNALEEIKKLVVPTSSLHKPPSNDTFTSIPPTSIPPTTILNTNAQVPQGLAGIGSVPIITFPQNIVPGMQPTVSHGPVYVNTPAQNYVTPGVYNPIFPQIIQPGGNQINQHGGSTNGLVNIALQPTPVISNVLQTPMNSTDKESSLTKPQDITNNLQPKDLNREDNSRIKRKESDNGHKYRRGYRRDDRSTDRDRGDGYDRRKRRDRRSRDKRSRDRRSRDRRYRDRRSSERRSRGRRSRERPSPRRKRKREDDEQLIEIIEPSQQDYPAPVVGRDSTYLGSSGQKWEIVMQSPKLRSYACYLRNSFDSNTLSQWMKVAEEKADWKQPLVKGSLLPRKAAWFVAPGCKCMYKYSSTQWAPTPYPDWFQAIQTEVMKRLGIPLNNGPNSCNVNLYYSGQASVGWHSDNERIFESKFRDCLIISLSLGVSRKFQVKTVGSEHVIKELVLGNGDLMTMEGLFQKHYLHRVPKEPRVEGKRLNFTWRWITAHDREECGMRPDWCPGHWFGRGSAFEKQKMLKRYDNEVSNDPKRGKYDQNSLTSSTNPEPSR